MHPSSTALLKFFKFDHLPVKLQSVSSGFCQLAMKVANDPDSSGPEVTVCLRKLLEAKDCAVRARLASINDGNPIPPDPPAPYSTPADDL